MNKKAGKALDPGTPTPPEKAGAAIKAVSGSVTTAKGAGRKATAQNLSSTAVSANSPSSSGGKGGKAASGKSTPVTTPPDKPSPTSPPPKKKSKKQLEKELKKGGGGFSTTAAPMTFEVIKPKRKEKF